MSIWRQLTRGLRALLHRKSTDRDIAEEVEQYLEEAAASYEAQGLSREDALRAAKRELGNMSLVREQVRDYGWENLIDTLVADIRYSVRRLRRSPAFTVAGALTLALGIGASTAIFSAVNSILLEPFPYPDPARLTMIWDRRADAQNDGRGDVTFGTFRELLQRSRSFEWMAAMRPVQVNFTGTAEPERVDGQYVSADYFRVLGVTPAHGRDFQETDDQAFVPGAPLPVILSDALWHRHFGGDPGIVGRQITVQDTPATVVGIMPKGFENVLSPSAEIWSTLKYDPALPMNGREWGHHLRVVGRLRQGVNLDQARQELDAIARTQLKEFPRHVAAQLQGGFIANPLHDDLTRDIKPALVAVVGASVLLLVIACVNVTNMLLARGAARQTELAVRAALGASRSRLTRQLVTETLLLTILGGLFGVGLAYSAVNAAAALVPYELPHAEAIKVDSAAIAFALALTTLIGVAMGMVPALHRSNADLHGRVQQGSPSIVGGYSWTRRTLVVVQVAVALVLLVNAGLLMRSLRSLYSLRPGFNAANVLTMQVQTAGKKFRDDNATNQFFAQVLESVRRIPGVSSAAFTTLLPLTDDSDTWGVQFESTPASAREEEPSAYRYAISPDYAKVMGITVQEGRTLNSNDVAGMPPAAVINRSFANRRIPGLNPIGQRLQIGPNRGFTVVGVVDDVKQMSIGMGRSDSVYVTAEQWHYADRARWLVVRAQRDAAALTPAIRRAVWSVDKNQPILRVATMDERLAASEAKRRFALVLFEAFGCVALLLAAIGTYSLLSGNITERRQEIGVRLAIGASRRNVLSLVLRNGMTLAGLGIVLGIVGALASSRALTALLFGISRFDAITYGVVIALLASVSAIACSVPAWKATRVRPSVTLRSQ